MANHELILLLPMILAIQFSVQCSSLRGAIRNDLENNASNYQPQQVMKIGPCKWILNGSCPDESVKFYLFTRKNMMDRQFVHVDETLEKSNLTDSYFNPKHPTKIIIHGYNSDMFLNSLISMKDEYLQKGEYNLLYVDWSVLSPAPCYFSGVHNSKHVGKCVAQLVERILDTGSKDIHAIGFSLGAQLTNFIALNLKSFVLPRITGLDPALPLFITSSKNEKLDASDAEFVDVIHTNALVQGKLERCGHVDFYMNGGIFQPGCTGNIFACSHQRAPAYYSESIRTSKGFWGWACSSYISYLLGMCPPTNYLVEAGENANPLNQGLYLITTAETAPFALGKWTDLPGDIEEENFYFVKTPLTQHSPLLKEVDEWGKLDGNFNNIEYYPPPNFKSIYDNSQSSEDKSDVKNTERDNNQKNKASDSRAMITRHSQKNVHINFIEFRRREEYKAEQKVGNGPKHHLENKSNYQVPRISYE